MVAVSGGGGEGAVVAVSGVYFPVSLVRLGLERKSEWKGFFFFSINF